MSKLTIAVTKHDHRQGSLDAACMLVEYGDYECPSCGEAQTTIKSLQAEFGDEMCFVFRNFPLREMHPWAEPAAEVAEFAATHHKFWQMHDLLFANQDSLSENMLDALLQQVDLAEAGLKVGETNAAAKKRIDADLSGGIHSGVNGTPTFFINGDRYDGPTDYASLARRIEHLITSNAG